MTSNARKTSAVKKSVSGIGKTFSDRADRVADIILDDDRKLKDTKAKRITNETVSMFKDVSRQLKANLKGVQPRDFLYDAAYNAGRFSRMTAQVSRKLWDHFLR